MNRRVDVPRGGSQRETQATVGVRSTERLACIEGPRDSSDGCLVLRSDPTVPGNGLVRLESIRHQTRHQTLWQHHRPRSWKGPGQWCCLKPCTSKRIVTREDSEHQVRQDSPPPPHNRKNRGRDHGHCEVHQVLSAPGSQSRHGKTHPWRCEQQTDETCGNEPKVMNLLRSSKCLSQRRLPP